MGDNRSSISPWCCICIQSLKSTNHLTRPSRIFVSPQIICIKSHQMQLLFLSCLMTSTFDFLRAMIADTASSFSTAKRWTVFVMDRLPVAREEGNRLSIILSLSAWFQPNSKISAWMTRSSNYRDVRFRGISGKLDDIISCRLGWSRRNISFLSRACSYSRWFSLSLPVADFIHH